MELARQLAQRAEWPRVIEEGELALQLADDDMGIRRSAHATLARAYAAIGQLKKANLHQRWIEQESVK